MLLLVIKLLFNSILYESEIISSSSSILYKLSSAFKASNCPLLFMFFLVYLDNPKKFNSITSMKTKFKNNKKIYITIDMHDFKLNSPLNKLTTFVIENNKRRWVGLKYLIVKKNVKRMTNSKIIKIAI